MEVHYKHIQCDSNTRQTLLVISLEIQFPVSNVKKGSQLKQFVKLILSPPNESQAISGRKTSANFLCDNIIKSECGRFGHITNKHDILKRNLY